MTTYIFINNSKKHIKQDIFEYLFDAPLYDINSIRGNIKHYSETDKIKMRYLENDEQINMVYILDISDYINIFNVERIYREYSHIATFFFVIEKTRSINDYSYTLLNEFFDKNSVNMNRVHYL